MKVFYNRYFKLKEVLFYSIMSIISVFVVYSVPQINRLIIDRVAIEGVPINIGLAFILTTIVLFFLHSYMMVFPNFFGSIQQCKIESRIRHDLVKKYLSLPYYEYVKFENSFLLNLFLSDVGNATSVLINFKVAKIVSVSQFIVFFIVVLWTDIKLGLITLVFVPFYFAALLISRKNLYNLSNNQNQKYDSYVSMISSIISGKKQINLSDAEPYFTQKQNENMDIYFKARLKREFVLCILNRLPVFIQALAPILILIYGAQFVQQKEMSIGTLIMFVQYAGMMFEPLGHFVQLLTQRNANIPAFERLSKVLFNDAKIKLFPDSCCQDMKVKIIDTDIYTNTKELLFHIDHLTIPKNGLYCIKGENGTGKTTFVNLLCSFYDQTYLQRKSECSVVEISRDFSNCSYLSHPAFVFDGPVVENISLGKAIDSLHLKNLCNLFNFNLLDKQVTANPVNLSDGELQKLCLIRTFVQDKEIIILDEPEKSLDLDSIGNLRTFVSNLKPNHLVIIISHTNAFDQVADAILQIQDYKLVVTQFKTEVQLAD